MKGPHKEEPKPVKGGYFCPQVRIGRCPILELVVAIFHTLFYYTFLFLQFLLRTGFRFCFVVLVPLGLVCFGLVFGGWWGFLEGYFVVKTRVT